MKNDRLFLVPIHRDKLSALKKIAKLAEDCLPPEAYAPKADGTPIGKLRDAIAELNLYPADKSK